jgi:hypothetical protein
MAEEYGFLRSTAEVCSCAKTVHVSSSYQADILYNHRYAMGAVKPDCPRLGLNIRASMETVAYSETIHQRDRQDERQADVKFLKDYAIRQIARFSHMTDKAAVLAYVDTGLDVTGLSALDVPLTVHQLISRVITDFITFLKSDLLKLSVRLFL